MKIKSLILTAAFTATAFAASGETRLEQGRWAIVNADDNTLDISFDGKEAIPPTASPALLPPDISTLLR